MRWTRDHKSECGRFWCCQTERSKTWHLYDRSQKDERGNTRRYEFRKLADAKAMAARLVGGSAQFTGKPLIDVL